MDNLEISKMLTLSTSHIQKSTNENLLTNGETDIYPVSVYRKEDFGFFIYFDHDNMKDYANNLPVDLFTCIKLADENGCEILCLDCDGPIVKGLPEYNW